MCLLFSVYTERFANFDETLYGICKMWLAFRKTSQTLIKYEDFTINVFFFIFLLRLAVSFGNIYFNAEPLLLTKNITILQKKNLHLQFSKLPKQQQQCHRKENA